jgi:hypothetical protein
VRDSADDASCFSSRSGARRPLRRSGSERAHTDRSVPCIFTRFTLFDGVGIVDSDALAKQLISVAADNDNVSNLLYKQRSFIAEGNDNDVSSSFRQQTTVAAGNDNVFRLLQSHFTCIAFDNDSDWRSL